MNALPRDIQRLNNRYHQQYLFQVPNGYCGTGVSCPVGLTTSSED
ncbi:hypothetical protein AB0C10_27550 [Microbispora amethystogenes]